MDSAVPSPDPSSYVDAFVDRVDAGQRPSDVVDRVDAGQLPIDEPSCDGDGDGVERIGCGGDDCNDFDRSVGPGGAERSAPCILGAWDYGGAGDAGEGPVTRLMAAAGDDGRLWSIYETIDPEGAVATWVVGGWTSSEMATQGPTESLTDLGMSTAAGAVVDDAGRLLVMGQRPDGQWLLARRDERGWTVDPLGVEPAARAAMALGPRGLLYVASVVEGTLLVSRREAGEWTTLVAGSADIAVARLDVDEYGAVHILLFERADVAQPVAYVSNKTGDWRTTPFPNLRARDADLVVGRQGHVTLAVNHQLRANDMQLHVLDDEGGTWRSRSVADTISAGGEVAVAADGSGRVHLCATRVVVDQHMTGYAIIEGERPRISWQVEGSPCAVATDGAGAVWRLLGSPRPDRYDLKILRGHDCAAVDGACDGTRHAVELDPEIQCGDRSDCPADRLCGPDSTCISSLHLSSREASCTDGEDNDSYDTQTDCADGDCAFHPSCLDEARHIRVPAAGDSVTIEGVLDATGPAWDPPSFCEGWGSARLVPGYQVVAYRLHNETADAQRVILSAVAENRVSMGLFTADAAVFDIQSCLEWARFDAELDVVIGPGESRVWAVTNAVQRFPIGAFSLQVSTARGPR